MMKKMALPIGIIILVPVLTLLLIPTVLYRVDVLQQRYVFSLPSYLGLKFILGLLFAACLSGVAYYATGKEPMAAKLAVLGAGAAAAAAIIALFLVNGGFLRGLGLLLIFDNQLSSILFAFYLFMILLVYHRDRKQDAQGG